MRGLCCPYFLAFELDEKLLCILNCLSVCWICNEVCVCLLEVVVSVLEVVE